MAIRPRHMQERWTARELHALQLLDPAEWRRVYLWDQSHIGTERYQGIAAYHHWRYRYLLADPETIQHARGRRTKLSRTEMMRLYRRIHTALVRAGLHPSGASPTHEAIIRRVLRAR